MPLPPDELWAALSDDEKAAAIAAATNPPPRLAAVPDPPAAALEGAVADAGDGYAELGEFLDDTLRLSVGGVHYDVPAADIETGLFCTRLLSIGAGAATGKAPTDKQVDELNDQEELELFERLLGPDIWQRLRDEGRPWKLVQHMGTTAMFWAGASRELALEFWKEGGRPKEAPAPAPRAPQDHLPARKGTATATRKRASSTGTTPKKPTARKGTAGRTS